MFFALFITLVVFSPMLVWLFLIRPYCVRNGKGYTPGAGWETTMWVDWQEARELAVSKGDKRMINACGLFLWIKLTYFLIGILVLLVSAIVLA